VVVPVNEPTRGLSVRSTGEQDAPPYRRPVADLKKLNGKAGTSIDIELFADEEKIGTIVISRGSLA